MSAVNGTNSLPIQAPFVCPETHGRLRIVTASAAERSVGYRLAPRRRTGPTPLGVTPLVALSEERPIAYPVLDGVVIALLPEQLTPGGEGAPIDVTQPRYAEAYEEMSVYTADSFSRIWDGPRRQLRALQCALERGQEGTFPESELWLGRGSTASACQTAYRYLQGTEGRTIVQLGGIGAHAIKFLLAGARSAVLVSPILDELRAGLQLAADLGLRDQFAAVGGIGEELPFADGSIDLLYSGSSLHHCQTADAFAEIHRALRPGGRFGSVDVWRAPLYDMGTKVFGRAHRNAYCQPFEKVDIDNASRHFDDVEVSWHGALVRYPLAVLQRVGVMPPARAALRMARFEDHLLRRHQRLSRHASLVVLRGER